MTRPPATVADWRAQVDKELAGRSFEKVLVSETPEGVPIAPLYTEAPAADPFTRAPRPGRFRICMRSSASNADDLQADIDGGADALWLASVDDLERLASPEAIAKTFFVVDVDSGRRGDLVPRLRGIPGAHLAVHDDPIGRRAQGGAAFATLADDLTQLAGFARVLGEALPNATSAMVSTLAYHDAGADGADEVAFALSTGARYLGALTDAGMSPNEAARRIALQVAVGRDTFVELCKLRALRTCWEKMLAASGVSDVPRTLLHAVCSHRTLTARDPWVNMLRSTTQVFSAVLGGADLVTPTTYDAALGASSAHARRVARNTGLVLREESFLGKVEDPAGGSYYLETVSLALAREAWTRFRALEKDGGIVDALASGRLTARLDAGWRARLDAIAKRKTPILGVSEFANVAEQLPLAETLPPRAHTGEALAVHRDSEAFEALRTRVEALRPAPEVVLLTLGSLSETRPRAGFAAGFFGAGGFTTRESTVVEKAAVACLCGTDDRYATDAASHAKALKSAGCSRVLLAGRPGALEPSLREAGVDGFIFVGSDVVETLSDLATGLAGGAS